jgi:hypothetical protein
MSSEYFLYIDQQYGPYDEIALGEHLKQGRLTQETWVFRNGETPDWTRAGDVVSLKALFLPVATPSKVGDLSDRLKQATLAPQDDSFGTMLVRRSDLDGVKSLESALPQAPLSDIPKQEVGKISPTAASKKIGFFGKLRNLFRR